VRRLISYIDVKNFSRIKKIHFFINVFIGITVVLFFHFVENTDWGEANINKAFDFIIKKEAEKSAKSMENLTAQRNIGISDKIVFAEIDHETYKKWGRPNLIPRDKLAEIIKIAYEGGAKIISLDILLEDNDCCHPQSEGELRKILQDMTDKNSATKVIFPVRVSYDGKIRTNTFQALIEKNPNFYAASAYISATAADMVVRYWVPFEIVQDDRNTILWNVSFLAAMLDKGKEAEIKDFEQTIKKDGFRNDHHFQISNDKFITITPDKDDIYRNRIRFLLVPQNTLSNHPGGNLFDNVYQLDHIKHANVKDKIVIIGNSSPDAGDIHSTPVGNMAGMFIIGNAINTLSFGLQPSRPPLWLNIMIDIVIVIMAAFIFLYFNSFRAKILSYVVIIPIVGFVSWLIFLYIGVLLNCIFALMGIVNHPMADHIAEYLNNKGANANEKS